MPFRFFILGLLLILVYRLIRDLLRSILNGFRLPHSGDAGTPKKRPRDLDETQIQDAEFRDLET